MHSTKRFLLKKGLGLTCVTNTQCKTSCLSAMFQLPLNSEGRSPVGTAAVRAARKLSGFSGTAGGCRTAG